MPSRSNGIAEEPDPERQAERRDGLLDAAPHPEQLAGRDAGQDSAQDAVDSFVQALDGLRDEVRALRSLVSRVCDIQPAHGESPNLRADEDAR
jgi:hypothetical protein